MKKILIISKDELNGKLNDTTKYLVPILGPIEVCGKYCIGYRDVENDIEYYREITKLIRSTGNLYELVKEVRDTIEKYNKAYVMDEGDISFDDLCFVLSKTLNDCKFEKRYNVLYIFRNK